MTNGWGIRTKAELVARLSEETGLSKKKTIEVLDSLTSLVYKEAKHSFALPGLGKFVIVNRKARMGRNPATGATMKIPAKRVLKFRVAKGAKDIILGKK